MHCVELSFKSSKWLGRCKLSAKAPISQLEYKIYAEFIE
jgi:hypothetical protein